MKILFITDIGSPWGGSEELWSKSAIDLAERGYNVSVVTNYFGKPYHLKIANVIDNGVQVYFRKNKLRDNIRKVAQKLNQTIISKNVRTNTEAILKKIAPDLVVFSQSSCFSAYKDMLYCSDNGYKYCSVSQLNSEFNWPNDNTFLNIRKAFVNAEKTFFVSHGNLNLFQTQIAHKLTNAEVISNPFNFDNIKQLDWPKTSTLNFAYVGRLDFTHKGIDVLLNAFATKEWKSRDFKLNIYGKGNLSLAKELVNFLGLEDKVIFKGHVNNIHSIWEENHILSLASRYEGMPLVLIEAMLCRRTAIVTDVAGHAELITDKENGFLAEASHVKLFRKKLEEVWVNKDDLKTLGEKSYQTINQKLENKPEIVFSNKLIELINK